MAIYTRNYMTIYTKNYARIFFGKLMIIYHLKLNDC